MRRHFFSFLNALSFIFHNFAVFNPILFTKFYHIMKKTLVVMMAFILGMAITSCKQGPKAEAEATETEATTAEGVKVLADLVEKAKAEGANWSVDQWKDAYKTAMSVMAPTMKELVDLTKDIKSDEEPDTAKLAAVMEKLVELKEKFKPYEGYMNQFDSIVKLYPNGRAVEEDEEFDALIKKEFGLTE